MGDEVTTATTTTTIILLLLLIIIIIDLHVIFKSCTMFGLSM